VAVQVMKGTKRYRARRSRSRIVLVLDFPSLDYEDEDDDGDEKEKSPLPGDRVLQFHQAGCGVHPSDCYGRIQILILAEVAPTPSLGVPIREGELTGAARVQTVYFGGSM